MPRYSIVVPAYNAESTLAETLEAIQAQTFKDWECVIVDDGSVDRTAAVGHTFATADARFVVYSQHNQGTASAYNTGVAHASADLLAICSADDILLPNHLMTMGYLIDRHPECDIFSSNGMYLLETGQKKLVYTEASWQQERSVSFEQVLACCFFSVGAVYRREVFEAAGGYRRDVYGEDYDFWLRAMAKGMKHCYTPDVLSLHRISDTQKSSDILRVYESNIEVYRNLVEGDWATGSQVPLVERAILARRLLIKRVAQEAEWRRRGDTSYRLLERAFGPRVASFVSRPALGLLRRVGRWRTRD